MAVSNLVAFLIVLLGMAVGQTTRAQVCNIECAGRPTLVCGTGRSSYMSGSRLLLNWTQSERKGNLQIDVIGIAEKLDDSLQLEAVPLTCGLSGVQEFGIIYRRPLPRVIIAQPAIARAYDTLVLKVSGNVHLDSLLEAMRGLKKLFAASANLIKPITELIQLRDLVLINTLWRPIEKSDPGLLASLPQLRSAKFSGGRLGRLRKGDFKALPKLQYLYFLQCEVTALDADVFEMGENSLKHLTLDGNLIDTLPQRVFEPVGASLEKLGLARNRLKIIDAQTFAGLTVLKELDLSSNVLRSLAPESFVGMRKLSLLNLGNNPMLIVFSGVESPSPSSNRIFCPLESLAIIHVDKATDIDCREFSLDEVEILIDFQGRNRRVLNCNRNISSSCTARTINQLSNNQVTNRNAIQQQQQQQQTSSFLFLMILGSVSLAHLVVVLVIVALCLRFGAGRSCRRCSPSRTATAARAVEIGEGDENGCGTFSLAGGSGGDSGGVGRRDSLVATNSDSAAAVLISFQTKKLNDDANEEMCAREKTCYQFNEDA